MERRALGTTASLPPEAQAVLAGLNGNSNEARLALLERRFTVPPSPVASREVGDSSLLLNQNSAHSCQSVRSNQKPPLPPREATPSASQGHLLGDAAQPAAAAAGRSLDAADVSSELPPTKRRRTAAGGGALPAAKAGGGGGNAARVAPPKPGAAAAAGGGDSKATSPPSALQRPSLSPFLTEGAQAKQLTPSSKQKQQHLNRYFPQLGSGEGAPASAGRRAPGGPSPPPEQQQQSAATAVAQLTAAQQEAATLRDEIHRLRAELAAQRQDRTEQVAALARLQGEAEAARQQGEARDGAARGMLMRLAVAAAQQEREATAARLQELAPRLGTLSVRRQGIELQQARGGRHVWEGGQAFKDLQRQRDRISEQREAIEAARKAAKRRLPLPGQPLPAAGGGGGDAAAAGGAVLHPDDWEEIFKARLTALKREEEALRQEAARLEGEKLAYMRDLKLQQDEEGSRFSNFPLLNQQRYLLLNLMGKGGFSEVFKASCPLFLIVSILFSILSFILSKNALDLATLREVAVKVNQLNPMWNEVKKASYVKHSMREYNIHKSLRHPRITALLDVFEIDNNSFGTVLELCEGGDLDAYLRQHETLPEKEAKAIVAQVMSGLAYMNTKPHSIIHYDLKPANILFNSLGEVKITDFGLSKIVAEGNTQGMELTSQGAGTYWYLPPECFITGGGAPPTISNKARQRGVAAPPAMSSCDASMRCRAAQVDVWSVGVIFFQMLFGRRPFGHEQSQEQILRNEVMLNAREVTFPSKPSVSAEAKDFIRACLAYRQADRLDVAAAATHPYLSFKRPARASAAAAAAAAAAKDALASQASLTQPLMLYRQHNPPDMKSLFELASIGLLLLCLPSPDGLDGLDGTDAVGDPGAQLADAPTPSVSAVPPDTASTPSLDTGMPPITFVLWTTADGGKSWKKLAKKAPITQAVQTTASSALGFGYAMTRSGPAPNIFRWTKQSGIQKNTLVNKTEQKFFSAGCHVSEVWKFTQGSSSWKKLGGLPVRSCFRYYIYRPPQDVSTTPGGPALATAAKAGRKAGRAVGHASATRAVAQAAAKAHAASARLGSCKPPSTACYEDETALTAVAARSAGELFVGSSNGTIWKGNGANSTVRRSVPRCCTTRCMRARHVQAVDGLWSWATAGRAAFVLVARGEKVQLLGWDYSKQTMVTQLTLPVYAKSEMGAIVRAASSDWAVVAGLVLNGTTYSLRSYTWNGSRWTQVPDMVIEPYAQSGRIEPPSLGYMAALTNRSAAISVIAKERTIYTSRSASSHRLHSAEPPSVACNEPGCRAAKSSGGWPGAGTASARGELYSYVLMLTSPTKRRAILCVGHLGNLGEGRLFGKYLTDKARPDWREQYINYSALKGLIKEAADDAAKARGPKRADPSLAFAPRTTSLTVVRAEGACNTAEERFFKALEAEVDKVGRFTAKLTADLRARLGQLQESAAAAKEEEQKHGLLEEAKLIGDEFLQLEKYVNLNYMGFHKILKKHDKMLPHSPCRQFYISHLHHQPWAFSRTTTKWWIRTADVSAVKRIIIENMPVFVFNPENYSGDAQLINSVYFDNDSLELYHGRLDKKPGAIALRIRWYGPNDPKVCFVERKVVPYLEGEYTVDQFEDDLRAKGKSEDDVGKAARLFSEIQATIDAKQLKPFVRTQYLRSAYQMGHDRSVSFTLDTNLVMLKENPKGHPSCAISGRWGAVPYWVDDESIRASIVSSAPEPKQVAPSAKDAVAISIGSKPRRRQSGGAEEPRHPLLGDAPTLQLMPSRMGAPVRKGIEVGLPQRLEPKTFLASERTFLSWLHMAVTIGSISAALLAFAANSKVTQDPVRKLSNYLVEAIALILLPLAISIVGYSLIVFVWRNSQIALRAASYIDDRRGPLLLSGLVAAAMSAIFCIGLADMIVSLRSPGGGGGGGSPMPAAGPVGGAWRGRSMRCTAWTQGIALEREQGTPWCAKRLSTCPCPSFDARDMQGAMAPSEAGAALLLGGGSGGASLTAA
eukprot:scaffold2.g7155.t1